MYRMYGVPRAQGCAGAAIARLVILAPKPRVNLTRYHGVFAQHSKYRALVTPGVNDLGKLPALPDLDALFGGHEQRVRFSDVERLIKFRYIPDDAIDPILSG